MIGYARVSTKEQNLDLRHDDVKPAFDASVDPTGAGWYPREASPPTSVGRWCAMGSARDRHWSRARTRILGESEVRPDRTITAVGRDGSGS